MRSSVLGGYILLVFALVIYSYSQIDLNLTLSSWGPYQNVQQQLIQLGYFNRPLSTNLYILFVTGLFLFWLYFLRLAYVGRLSKRSAFKLVMLTTGVLLFSYPAFSHDVFNYMFDARIMTLYGQNPYTHRPMDFPSDLWLRFMHWVHRYTPYGPIWLGISVVPSFLAMGKFVPTLFGFKLVAAGSHILATWFIGRIVAVHLPRFVPAAVILFGLHPLLIVESLVSAHNDGVMMALALGSAWAIQQNRWALSVMLLVFSVGVKYVTAVLAPAFIGLVSKRLSYTQFGIVSTSFLLGGIGVVVAQIFNKGATGAEFHPWFLVWPLGFAALIPHKRWIHAFFAILSLGLLMRYVPFLLVGDYPEHVQEMKTVVTIIGAVVGLILSLIIWRKHAET